MLVADIARITDVEQANVRAFLSRHEIPRKRKQGKRGVFVNVDAYIEALRVNDYQAEAAKLEVAAADIEPEEVE